MNAQTPQPRLHIVSCLTAEQDFSDVYAELEQAAKTVVVRTPLSADDAWVLAQFVDLVDAGHGNPRSALYRCAKERLSVFVEFNLYRPQVRALCGRAACLAAMAAQRLDDLAADSPTTTALALAA